MQTVQAQVALANMQVQHTGGPGQHAGTAHRWPWPTCRYSTCGMGQQHVGTVQVFLANMQEQHTGGPGQYAGTAQVALANNM